MNRVIHIIITLLMPTMLFADSYTALWKKVAEAQGKDLPQTQIEWLERIEKKAVSEKQYGQLLKAQLQKASVKTQISPDSLATELERLEKKATSVKDEALRAVYASALGKVYESQYGDDTKAKSKQWFAESMKNPKLLASVKSTAYEPAIVAGIDSKIFYDDLLHVLGFEAKDFKTLHSYYEQNGNRPAACITALYQLRQERQGNITRVKKSAYVQRVDSLMKAYADLREAGEVAIEHYNVMAECTDVTAEDRVNFINYALSRWGAWPHINVLRNALADLQRPRYNVNIGDYMMLPNAQRLVRVNSIRNIGELTLNIYRLNVDGNTNLDPENDNDYKKLQRLMVPGSVQTQSRRYIGQPAWKENSDSITIEPLPVGVYLVEATTDNREIAPQRALLRVSNLYVMNETQPDGSIRFVVVDATTGKPVAGAKIELTMSRRFDTGKNEKVTLTTDKKGEARYAADKAKEDNNPTSPVLVYAYTDDDKASGNFDINSFYAYWERDETDKVVTVVTDRSIYRPGQQVHAAAIVFNKDQKSLTSQAVSGEGVTFVLRDANYKEVSTQQVTTDSYGTASALFTLPQGGLTGSFTISARANKAYATTGFSVEQYKRPTFEVKIDDYKQAYQPGDTVTMRGVAKSYAGVPVQGGKVEYTVKRQESLLWWWRRPGTGAGSETLFTDSAITADDGSFEMKLPMIFPENVDTKGALYYNVVVDAKVTDLAGETHEANASLPLSNRTSVLTSNLPEKTLADSLKTITFTRRNVAGKDIAGTVSYQIDGGAWAKAEAGKAVTLSKRLASGRHTLTAICEGDTLKQEVVVFSYNDKRPAIETHDWLYLSANEFPADGKPVYLQVGSSDEDVHIYYSVFQGRKVLDQGSKVISNEVITQKLSYKPEYGDGITVNMAWVKSGQLYWHSVTIQRPMPNNKQTLVWKTFRDQLTPGQKEEWTLQVLGPDGKPARAQLMATMYDKSLDQIRSHRWNFAPRYYLSVPTTRWDGGSDTAVGLYGFLNIKGYNERALSFSHFDDNMFYFGNILAFDVVEQLSGAVPGIRVRGTRAMRAAVPMGAMAKNSEMAAAHDGVYPEEESKLESEIAEPEADQNGSGSMRENLNETAFFFPALTTDERGNVTIKFTLPESVTTWRLMGISHDEHINYGTIEAEAVAKKKVMVMPNLPRFMRVGDKAQVSARIVNTTNQAQRGRARLQLLDPETEAVVAEWTQSFDLAAETTAAVTFDVDADKVAERAKGNTLFIARVSAEGRDFSDGEQHYLPLLPNREYVTTTVPFTQNGAGTKTIDLKGLFPTDDAQNKLTIEYTNNPAWLVVQALPSVANPNEKNAISLATAIYANRIGKKLLQSSPKIAQTIKLWQQESGKETSLMSNLQKNEELKSMVLAETPWVADAERETDQKQQLVTFLDESTIDYRLQDATAKLQALQNPDGSFSWWPGMQGSPYTTVMVMQTLVRLDAMTGSRYVAKQDIARAFSYLDRRIAEEVAELKKLEKKGEKQLAPSEFACNYLYTSALAGRKPSADVTYLVGLLEKMPTKLTIYGKAGSAVILAQYGKQKRAEEYMESLNQYAVYKEEMGRYFDTRRAQYSWFDYKVPTQVAAIEAMKMLRPADTQTIEEMQRWLLQQKRTTSWDTPINAVNAVYAFLAGSDGKADMSKLATGERATLKVDGKALDLPQATAGIGYVKTTAPARGANTFEAEKTSGGTSWGAVYAQYWQRATDVTSASAGLTVKRQVLTADGKPLTGRLRVGDKVKVRIVITADRNYDFVQVRDKRAACLEPVSQLSGYRWGYYLAPQDNATNYYFDRLAKGTHTVETDYYVDREGDYTTGICTAECAYSLEFSAREAAIGLSVGR